jgi:hypothetical protein
VGDLNAAQHVLNAHPTAHQFARTSQDVRRHLEGDLCPCERSDDGQGHRLAASLDLRVDDVDAQRRNLVDDLTGHALAKLDRPPDGAVPDLVDERRKSLRSNQGWSNRRLVSRRELMHP